MRDLLEPVRRFLVDLGPEPGHTQPFRDDQQRDGQFPQGGARQHRPGRACSPDRDERGPGLLRDALQRGILGPDAGQAAAAPRRLGRDGQRLRGGTRGGHRDHRVGRPDPARQALGLRGDDLDRAARPDDRAEHLTGEARAAQARGHQRARPGVRGEGRQVRLLARPQRGTDLRRRRRHLPQHVPGIGRLDHVGRVEPVRGQRELGPAPVVQAVAHAVLSGWSRAVWPLPRAAPGCRLAPGRPARTSRWCTPARWRHHRPAAASGIRDRPGYRGASLRSASDLPIRKRRSVPDDAEYLVAQGRHGGLGGRLHVQPQQRLGVGRPHVEPPVAGRDGEPVELVGADPGRPAKASLTRAVASAWSATSELISPLA